MDERTIRYYDDNAAEVAARYEAGPSPIAKYLRLAFPAGARLLDIGAGSGRDMAHLVREGYVAYGVEPSAAMRAVALERHPELTERLFAGQLPDAIPELPGLKGPFDGIICSAVLQHLERGRIFDATYALRDLLVERGRVLVAVPLARPDVGDDSRDADGRLFSGVTPDELELLFERVGFASIGRWVDEDALGRSGIQWSTMLLERRTAFGARPLDAIKSILSLQERKVATYKLALLRALCDIALTQSHRAVWRSDRRVAVPLAAVAERWVLYYWPLFSTRVFLPQMNGEAESGRHRLAFASELNALIEAYQRAGGMSAYAVDRRGGALPAAAAKPHAALMRKMHRAIVEGPVTFVGGARGQRLFDYERGGWILVPAELWRELALLGYWIRDALVLRWAELVSRLSRGEVPASAVVVHLMAHPQENRETEEAKEVYRRTSGLRCVWTDRLLSPGTLHVDHVIPFSIWRNNDLWNLLPSYGPANSQKSDKLPERRLLIERRPAILDCWELTRSALPRRFLAEAAAQTGQADPTPTSLFDVLLESVEVTALQRGTDRWAPRP